MQVKSKETKQDKQLSPSAHSIEAMNSESGGIAIAAPPILQLKGEYADDVNFEGFIQKKTTHVTLPENLGTTQEGPVATKGKGDSHAFSPNDINQGSIGDCFFLASLGAVANTNPELLRKAITQNSDGTFTVKLYQKKETGFWFFKKTVLSPVNVIIYPTFPVSVDGTDSANPDAGANPAHAHGGDKDSKGRTELWIRLIEKAYALLMGSYAAIANGGFSADALETLTGVAHTEKVKDKGTRARIIEMVKNNQPVTVSTHSESYESMSESQKKFARENSLVGGHAYTVMSADKSKIVVRNPWGTGARRAEVTLTWAQFDVYFQQFSDRN